MKTFKPTQQQKITIPPHRKYKKVLFISMLLIIAGGIIWWFSTSKTEQVSHSEQAEQLYPAINGVMVSKQAADSRPIATVIENSPEARPQSGLSDAEIVYETVAEGGITRFLALFQNRDVKEIGPVRSARPYFNFLADLWGTPIVHSGGSKQALSELSAGVYKDLFDVNEFYYGKYFKRDKSKIAPHNLYTSKQELTNLLDSKGELEWDPKTMWQFENIPTDQLANEVTNITIPFSFALFEARYQFDTTTNTYKRFINGEPQIDKNNDHQISPSNILVQLTDVNINRDDELGTMNIRLSGNGPCYLFKGGKFYECRWQFENGKHIYTDKDGNLIKLQPGQTWVEIFPRDKQSALTWN